MNTSETLEATNKNGSREEKKKKRREGGDGVVVDMADKQVETGDQRHTGKQLDNEVDCAPVCQVVWETLRPGWEVLSSETGRRRQKKQNPKPFSGYHFPLN